MTDYFTYTLEDDNRPTLGLIVLQADETIESDFHKLFSSNKIRLHISRIPSGMELTPETINDMKEALPQAAGLLPRGVKFDAVGYACTSGTTLIGDGRVTELVRSGCDALTVTNPLNAAIEAIKALNLKRVGIISPYVVSVAGPLHEAFQASGISVPKTLSFGEKVEANVARITQASIRDAARYLARDVDLDGIFLSCTNLRTLDCIPDLEAELGCPVISSNLALAWRMAKYCNADLQHPSAYQLLKI